MKLTQPLSPRQNRLIRTHLALIPVYVWFVFIWTAYAIDISTAGRLDRSGHIKGHDFAHFYVLGEIAREHAVDDLYSFSAHAARMDRLVPEYEARFLPIHAPQVAVFFAPFAGLPYPTAFAMWIVLSVGTYIASCWAVWKAVPALGQSGWIVALFAAACPAFYALVSSGQTSAFALLWFALGFLALRQERPWLAGLALGTLVYKPTLGLVLPFALLYARQYRVLLGALVSVAFQVIVVLAVLGKAALIAYIHNFRDAAQSTALLEARPELMHSLKTFFSALIPAPDLALTCYVVAAIIVAGVAIRAWRSQAPLELRYAILLLASVLVDPHVYTYELVVLVPALMLLASCAARQSHVAIGLWIALACSYALPAFTPLTLMTGVQWSVLAFTALLILAVRRTGAADKTPVAAGMP